MYDVKTRRYCAMHGIFVGILRLVFASHEIFFAQAPAFISGRRRKLSNARNLRALVLPIEKTETVLYEKYGIETRKSPTASVAYV